MRVFEILWHIFPFSAILNEELAKSKLILTDTDRFVPFTSLKGTKIIAWGAG
jgi:hypothetical protein